MSYSKRPRSQLTPLSDSLGKALNTGFLNFTAQKLRVFDLWPQVVGPMASQRTRPKYLRDGLLVVEVPGPAWLANYRYLLPQWLKKLNLELGGGAVIDEIKLEVGEF